MIDDHHLLGPFVRRFLLEDVIVDRNLSRNTQKSYRDTIRLLLGYIRDEHATEPTRVTVEQISVTVVRNFLNYLEEDRGNSTPTRNLRLTALHSLFRYISCHVPELIDQASQIRAIPSRRISVPVMPYLEKDEMDAVLAVPDRQRSQGRRDYALLLFLYNSGARASEAAKIRVVDIDPDNLSVCLYGKGRKFRTCPLWPHTVEILLDLLGSRWNGPREAPVFLNVHRRPITRFGIHDLVARTAEQAAKTVPSLGDKRVTPHTIRHTTAVHLLRADVDINTIRAWLGHVSLETTNRYTEVDLEMKTRALNKCAVEGSASETDTAATWHSDSDLMSFLESL